MNILKKIQDINYQRIRESWLYKKLSSLKTSILFLGILIFFYILGTIFPQGGRLDDYIQEGGRFTSFVIFFDLLNIFTTPGFLISALLLFINLTVCAFERFLTLWRYRTAQPEDVQFTPTYAIPIEINPHWESTQESVREILIKEFGFKELQKEIDKKLSATVLEKGLSYRWLTWMYHVGIFLCFFGFFMTYFFAFEDEVTLLPKEETAIKPSVTSRWNESWGKGTQELEFKLVLDKFLTEYHQLPFLDYPKDKLSRLAIAMGWRDPKYSLKTESYFPKDWKSRLSVIKEGQKVFEKTIEVNDPLTYKGMTFYQAAYKQDIKIQVDDNPILLQTDTDRELIVPGMEGTLKFGTLRTGTLFKRDGSTEEIKPFIDVTLVKKDSTGKRETEKLGKLELNGTLFVHEKKISLREFIESSILSYRYDPGVPILWWAGIFVLLTMSMRVFGAWYRVIYRVEEQVGGIPNLLVTVKTRGLMADEEQLINKLKHRLQKTTEPIDPDMI